MIAADEDALVCDLAETYQIFDYRAVPVQMLARLAVGLRPDSRIRLILSDSNLTTTEILLAGIMDRLSQLAWMQTVDAQKGRNQPASILDLLLGNQLSEAKEGAIKAFDSPAEFEAALKAAKGGDGSGN